MRGDITAAAGEITVSRISVASKKHECGYCGGPVWEGQSYSREETVDAKFVAFQPKDANFWRRWGRIPYGRKVIGVFHELESECQQWLSVSDEPDDNDDQERMVFGDAAHTGP